jgi:hypothetical protein
MPIFSPFLRIRETDATNGRKNASDHAAQALLGRCRPGVRIVSSDVSQKSPGADGRESRVPLPRNLVSTLATTGRELDAAAHRLRLARIAAAAAEQDYNDALDAALRAGWTGQDLTHIADLDV